MPHYYDCVQYVDKHYGDKRGRVFWRSMDRIRCILINVVAKAFTEDPIARRSTALAIKALEFMRTYETESGIEHFFDIERPTQPLSPDQRAKVIELFNGPPLIAASHESSFRSEWISLWRWLLIAAVDGSERCIKYFKNPGRELDHILPMDSLKTSSLYFRGCA
jgi:hypothetical protein